VSEALSPRRHDENCPCWRCRGFADGNQVAKGHGRPPDHGAYSMLRLPERAAEIAEGLREQMGALYAPRFSGLVDTAALAGARLEAAATALEAADGPDQLRRLEADARGWAREWLRCLVECGLTPRSATELGVLRVRGEALRALAEERERADAIEGEASDDD
jgi:hypothetical protein